MNLLKLFTRRNRWEEHQRDLAIASFDANMYWKKPNILMHKGAYAIAQFEDGRFEVVTRNGMNPWMALGGWAAAGKVVRVMPIYFIPTAMWTEKYEKGTVSVCHPVTHKWLDTKFINV